METNKEKETPKDNTAPLGATPEERVENGTESGDDLAELAKKTEEGEYTPSPETEQEMKDEGLLPNDDPQPEVPPVDSPPAPQDPNADIAGQQQQPEQPSMQLGGQVPDPNAAPQSMEDIYKMIDQGDINLNNENKEKAAGIIGAYQQGLIDKNQRDYFLMDSIMKGVNNVAKVRDEYGRRNRWDYKGDAKTPELDNNTAWTDFLKTDWTEAQKRKNDAKSTATKESMNQTMELLKKQGNDKYMYNIRPEIINNSAFGKMTPEEKANYMVAYGMAGDGNFSREQMNTYLDTMDRLANSKSQEDQDLQAKIIANRNATAQARITEADADIRRRMNELEARYKSGQITAQDYDIQRKALDNENQSLQNSQDAMTLKYKVEKERAEMVKSKFGDAKIKLGAKIPGLGEAGAELSVATIVNAGWDIGKLLKDGLSSTDNKKLMEFTETQQYDTVANDVLQGTAEIMNKDFRDPETGEIIQSGHRTRGKDTKMEYKP